MHSKSIVLHVSDAIGKVSGKYILPEKSTCIMTLAHGAGAGMDHPFMTELAGSLAEAGIATLRFNFPFMEHKKGRPDRPAVAQAAIAAAIDHAQSSCPALPLFVSGKSFGGRMTSQYLAANPRALVKGMIFYGFPLHASGKPSVDRAEHLRSVKTKMLFLQGTRDELAAWDLIQSVCTTLPKATLFRIENANHMFKAGKTDVMAILVKATADWIAKVAKAKK